MKELIVTDSSRQRWILICATFAIFMSNLDVSIVNISLPVISQHFNVSISIVSRVVLVYFLILTSFLLPFGKLGDARGFKTVFVTGFFVFMVGSFLCGISTSINMLIGFRVIQALGGSILTALAPAVVSTLLPPEIRGRSLGIVGTSGALGISLGPAIGGFITALLSWRWIFFINVPLGIIAILIGMHILPRKKVPAADSRFDTIGAILIFFALMTLLYAMNMGQEEGWTSPLIVSSFAVSIACFTAFFMRETKISYPILDPGLFRNWNFSMGMIASFFTLMVLNGTIFLFPFYLEILRKLATDKAGLILVVPSAVMIFMGPLAGGISDKIGSRWLCAIGMFLCTGAFLMFSSLNGVSSIAFIVLSLAWFGFTAGFFMAPNSSLVMGEAPEEKQGIASGVMMLVRNGGGILGICFFETVFSSSLPQDLSIADMSTAHCSISAHILAGAFHNAFLFGAILCVAAALFSVLIKQTHK
ncbi:MAG: MFS transporter, partial [Deltaproteobacteria bacterium]|nr:MFS transporter [Deltaproteobacteria bacterium]